jgi:hypothetical protein
MTARLIACLILPIAAACTGTVQRSVRAPHPGVPLQSGQPLETGAELGLGLSSVTDVMAPKVGNPTEAVEVPGTQGRAELRFRPGKPPLTLGLHYEHGFASTSQTPDATQAPVGEGDVRGYGASMRYAFPTSTPGLVIATTVELTGWSLPYVEYSTCTNCIDGFTVVDRGRANPLTLGVGFQPSWNNGTVTLFGGAFARNHPTAERKSVDQLLFDDGDSDVRSGPFNLLLHAGIEVAFSPLVSGIVIVHQNVVADPVRYGPGVGAGLSVKLGR